MKWSNELPTQRGWYWITQDPQEEGSASCIEIDSEKEGSHVLAEDLIVMGNPFHVTVDDLSESYGGQVYWAGPIPEPKM